MFCCLVILVLHFLPVSSVASNPSRFHHSSNLFLVPACFFQVSVYMAVITPLLVTSSFVPALSMDVTKFSTIVTVFLLIIVCLWFTIFSIVSIYRSLIVSHFCLWACLHISGILSNDLSLRCVVRFRGHMFRNCSFTIRLFISSYVETPADSNHPPQ